MEHHFAGQWITDREFENAEPVNVFHRQLQPIELPEGPMDRHILFRKRFTLASAPEKAELRFTADDTAKVWLNGHFVTQGAAPAYRSAYGYLTVDVTALLHEGENVLAFHTLYQGLINRVWVSGDGCHGLLFDLIGDGEVLAKSDESVLTAPHDGFSPLYTVGYDTQFMEKYDSRSDKAGFELPDYDDSTWKNARKRQHTDYVLLPQQTAALVFEEIRPAVLERRGRTLFADFGAMYVGTLQAKAQGRRGDEIVLRFGQELNADGSVRWELRANCRYEERWVLSGGRDTLDEFDYKSFRYAELLLPEGCGVGELSLLARHYPFRQNRGLKAQYAGDEKLEAVFSLCARSLEYGVQEVIQDCMEREKGFYLGDGCYSALAHLLLTDDDSLVRRLIEEAFRSAFITDTLVTCLDCSFMQEIAEYPLMLPSLMLWHYRIRGDRDFLGRFYPDVCALLDAYRAHYERDGLLQNVDKWCVVEWPAEYRDGYDADLTEGQVCRETHIALNAYYVEAVHSLNRIAQALGLPEYRNALELEEACRRTFFDPAAGLFRDRADSGHRSYIGNLLALYAGLFRSEENHAVYAMIDERGVTGVNLFGAAPLLISLTRDGEEERLRRCLRDENAWLRILREGGTATFEGWGKDTKWNTSLFHLTLTLAAIFLADFDTEALFA